MIPEARKILELQDATLVVYAVLGVLKGTQPATLQTPDIPYNHVLLIDGGQAVLMYDSVEDRDAEYAVITEAIKVAT